MLSKSLLPLVLPLSLLACEKDGATRRGPKEPIDATEVDVALGPRPGALPAFPGAEGFGAGARGGRGGQLCTVTTLAKSGSGSLQACLSQRGARTVIFRVSGVIEGPLLIEHGQLTIAGQTSPAGIIVKGGIACDNVYDPYDCNDVIVRHLRLRGGAPDGFRIGGAHDVILDHCSIAGAEDENLEITRARNITVQHTVIAEPWGDHYKWGGVLINYSKDVMPLDGITLHHNLWSGVSGRLPEVSCEENDDGPGRSNCAGHTIHLELTNNVYWDVYDPIWYNRCTGNNQGNDCAPSKNDLTLAMNLVGNVMARRQNLDPDLPFIEPAVWTRAQNAVYARDNLLMRGATTSRFEAGKSAPAPHAFPAVSSSAASGVVAAVTAKVGARPRDAMDTRIVGYLDRSVDGRAIAWEGEKGLVSPDAFIPSPTMSPPSDGDADGMPDAWERAHGTNPSEADNNDLTLASRVKSPIKGCTNGYTALECYLNELAGD